MQLEAMRNTVWVDELALYAVMSLLCAEAMSYWDRNCCIPLSVVKFQSVCHCDLFKGQGYVWAKCRVCILGGVVLELWWTDMSTAIVMQNHNLWLQEG
jgi:hypothetical protein